MKPTLLLLASFALLASCSNPTSSDGDVSSLEQPSSDASIIEESSLEESTLEEPSIESTVESSEESLEEPSQETSELEIPNLGELTLVPTDFPVKDTATNTYPVDAEMEKDGYSFLCNGVMQGNKNSTVTFALRAGKKGGASFLCKVPVHATIEIEYIENLYGGNDNSGTLSYATSKSLENMPTEGENLPYVASEVEGRRKTSFVVDSAYFVLLNASTNAVNGTKLTITPTN